MGRLAAFIFGATLGVIGTVSLVKFPDLTEKVINSAIILIKNVVEYLKGAL